MMFANPSHTPGVSMHNDVRSELAALGRQFHQRGWMLGTAGNLSCRQADGTLWVTASGVDKGALTIDDFVRVELDGRLVEAPDGKRASAETCLHQSVYSWSDTVGACLHVHTVASNLVSRLWKDRIPLPPIEMIKGLGIWDEMPAVHAEVFDNPANVPLIGEAVTEQFHIMDPEVPFYVVRDHGITVWGNTLREATNRLECTVYILDYVLAAVQANHIWWTEDPR